jgi:ComF family protein
MCSIPGVMPVLQSADLVVPVPLAGPRLQERGFNQALLLARAMVSGKVDARLLLRVRHTQAQSQLSRAARLRNLQSSLAVDPLRAMLVAQRRIVLVDDVMTTGATLQACAGTLRQAGASHVHAIVFARTPAP